MTNLWRKFEIRNRKFETSQLLFLTPESWRLATSSSCGADGERGLDVGDELAPLTGEGAEFTLDLEAMPEVVGLTEERPEADGHGRGDGAFPEHDLIDGAGRNPDGPGHGVLGNSHGLEILFQQDFSGSDR